MTPGGARPAHLGRRGAVYFVRFRLPGTLANRLGLAEIQKSLQTKDLMEARRRCLRATAWFSMTMEKLSAMVNPTRADLEQAARAFFHELTKAVDQPRHFD